MVDAPEDARTSARLVALQVDADIEQLYVVRAVAGVIATREGFDLDGVEDVRLAVDEVATMMVALADNGAQLSFSFATSDEELHVEALCVDTTEGLPAERGFGWHVVRTLTDSLEARQTRNAGGTGRAHTTVVRFSKRKAVPPR